MTWLRAHACAPIQWRTLTEILPPNSAREEDVEQLRAQVAAYQGITQIVKRQSKPGVWPGGILAYPKAADHKDAGTVFQYRRLLELGIDPEARPIRHGSRVLFQLLSRDPDPKLAYEFRKDAAGNPELADWVRERMREASAAALAESGHDEDPRVRGAAQRSIGKVSQFMRTDLAEAPFETVGAKNVLAAGATPPTLYTVSLVAHMPSLQRERAGFVERLTHYLARPAPLKPYVLKIGGKTLKPSVELLGDPLQLDAAGRPRDLPFGLYWLETLARLGMVDAFPTAKRALIRLIGDCDDGGIWNPKGLRGTPKSASKLADFAFPLEIDFKDTEKRKTDVTFRLALIAKHIGCALEYT